MTLTISVSGDFSDASEFDTCIKGNWVRAVLSALPAWFRFAQCLRRYKDSREAFPHLVNAGKYSTTLFVAVFSFLDVYYTIHYSDSNVSICNKGFAISGNTVEC